METQVLQEVTQCLHGERTLLHYFEDKYALDILERVCNKHENLNIASLKQSRWAPLLARPLIRKILAKSGSGELNLNYLPAEELVFEPFVLTIDSWANEKTYSWSQVSRPGANLVLQLNLPSSWTAKLNSLFGSSTNEFFGYSHPLSEAREHTLAWARLDFDFTSNEVLIEEIQSDLIGFASYMKKRAELCLKRGKDEVCTYSRKYNAKFLLAVCNDLLDRYGRIWQEVMLSSAIAFAFDELGFREIFYHSFESGIKLKNIDFSKPPKSIYSQLPKKFCFTQTKQAPEFLAKEKKIQRKMKKIKDMQFFHLCA